MRPDSTYQEIADTLGISTATAWKLCNRDTEEPPKSCPGCGVKIKQASRGRPRIYCDTCGRQRGSKDAERFWSKVRGAGTDECWEWQAGLHKGYGRMRWGGRAILAHRISWELEHGEPAPENLLVRHICDNPLCVNPAHLLLGSHLDNKRDSVQRGRHRAPKGELHGRAKLTAVQVEDIRAAKGHETAKALAGRHGVTSGTIYRIWSGKRWQEPA